VTLAEHLVQKYGMIPYPLDIIISASASTTATTAALPDQLIERLQ
jgi:hypothetical protein